MSQTTTTQFKPNNDGEWSVGRRFFLKTGIWLFAWWLLSPGNMPGVPCNFATAQVLSSSCRPNVRPLTGTGGNLERLHYVYTDNNFQRHEGTAERCLPTILPPDYRPPTSLQIKYLRSNPSTSRLASIKDGSRSLWKTAFLIGGIICITVSLLWRGLVFDSTSSQAECHSRG